MEAITTDENSAGNEREEAALLLSILNPISHPSHSLYSLRRRGF